MDCQTAEMLTASLPANPHTSATCKSVAVHGAESLPKRETEFAAGASSDKKQKGGMCIPGSCSSDWEITKTARLQLIVVLLIGKYKDGLFTTTGGSSDWKIQRQPVYS